MVILTDAEKSHVTTLLEGMDQTQDLMEPIKVMSRARSASPNRADKARHSALEGPAVKVLGGTQMSEAAHHGIKHAMKYVEQLDAQHARGLISHSPDRKGHPLQSHQSKPFPQLSLSGMHGNWTTGHTPHSHAQSPNKAGPKTPPENVSKNKEVSRTYARPWLQKNKPGSFGGDAAKDPDTKLARRCEKEIITWWVKEAKRMNDVIEKLDATTEDLKAELAEAKKTVRHLEYEHGLTSAAYQRQSEQATKIMAYRAQLEQEVSTLRGEKETSELDAIEKGHEIANLDYEVQELQEKIKEVKQHKQLQKAKVARQKDKEKARRERSSSAKKVNPQGSESADENIKPALKKSPSISSTQPSAPALAAAAPPQGGSPAAPVAPAQNQPPTIS